MPAGIDYKTNTSITAVDVGAKTLTAASGDTISYEKLIVATGARVSSSCTLNMASRKDPAGLYCLSKRNLLSIDCERAAEARMVEPKRTETPMVSRH